MNDIFLTANWEESFRNREQWAFKTFYDDTIRQLASHIIDKCDPEWADLEDILAESYCRLFYRVDKCESYDHARRSLFVMAKNLAVDLFREKKKGQQIREAAVRLYADMTTETNDDDLYESQKCLLRDRVKNLPNRMGLVIKHMIYEGKNTRAVAAIMQCSPQTVLNLKNDAIKKLMLQCTEKIHDRKLFKIL